ncbi:NAD-dependent epimerase/dehydratase family protein [Leifsonia sp. ALI-44-B]|uniref:NAD-dependent epimerase/dehydratase family protein n=1 Tax=Leifsonia sp. ALI-44-B TaxID=1933776 RepID=UPI0009F91FCC|nr:NAD-dependent epimerase/dehydratase family protein [Leifsonia sp. ALI-44-B]
MSGISCANTPRHVALTGSTGFVGGAILDALDRSDAATTVLTRHPRLAHPRVVAGHLGDTDALDTLVGGAAVVVHAASYIGADPELCRVVNVEGTRRLVEAARRAGVERVLYVSTAGVYGDSLRGGETERTATPSPRSTLSTSRRDAENIVLDAGGTVIRPHFVFGPGDRWFLGGLLPLMRALDARIGSGSALVSVIERRTLGELIAALALQPFDSAAGVFHAALPRPVPFGHLVDALFAGLAATPPQRVLSPAAAARLAAPLGVTPSQIDAITRDTWFDTSAIWRGTGLPQPEQPVFDAASLAWYAERWQPRLPH